MILYLQLTISRHGVVLFQEEKTAILQYLQHYLKVKNAGKKCRLQLTKICTETQLSIMCYPLRFAIIQIYNFVIKKIVCLV